jgi:predicted GNAT family acetyltransferase
VELARHADAESFLAAAGGFLGEREAEHNLILGLSSRLVRQPLMYGEPPYFAVVEDGGRIVGASLRTPPHNLILSELDTAGAVAALVEDARDAFGTLPGVVGPKGRTVQFANAWRAATGATPRLELAQRIFAADHVDEARPTTGAMRDYDREDRELAIRWMDEFTAEALPEGPHPETSEAFVDRREEDPDGGLVIWDDEGPVSLAGFGGRTPNGIRVGPVYTPPDLRGRGYASALTAALTRRLLESGRRFCFLYTDLANPTSNSIYQRIGYRAVGDADLWSFTR